MAVLAPMPGPDAEGQCPDRDERETGCARASRRATWAISWASTASNVAAFHGRQLPGSTIIGRRTEVATGAMSRSAAPAPARHSAAQAPSGKSFVAANPFLPLAVYLIYKREP